MYRKLADTIVLDFTVHLPTTGAVSDADGLPTVEVWEDETDATLAGGTVTKRVGKTGNYRVAVVATSANGFEVGKSYNVVVTVIAGGITAKAVIGSFFIDGKRLSDLNNATQGATKNELDAAELAIRGGDADTLKTLSDQLDVAQTDLDDPAQYKATGFATPTNVSNTQTVITDAIAALNNATQGATKDELDAAQAAIEAAMPGEVDLTALINLVTRALGLAGENMVMDQTVFDSDKKLTQARVRIYDSAAHAIAAGDTGLIATFPLTITWAAKLLETMVQVIL